MLQCDYSWYLCDHCEFNAICRGRSGSCRRGLMMAGTQTTDERHEDSRANRSQMCSQWRKEKHRTLLQLVQRGVTDSLRCSPCSAVTFRHSNHSEPRVGGGELRQQTTVTSKYTHTGTCSKIYRMRLKQKKKKEVPQVQQIILLRTSKVENTY